MARLSAHGLSYSPHFSPPAGQHLEPARQEITLLHLTVITLNLILFYGELNVLGVHATTVSYFLPPLFVFLTNRMKPNVLGVHVSMLALLPVL